MIKPGFIDDTVRRISAGMPTGARRFQEDMEKNMRAILSSALSKLDIVSREEFDIQQGVLRRSREKIENMERRLAELEASLGRKQDTQDVKS